MTRGMRKRMLNWIANLWCRKMHSGAMWPIHGRYICPRCLREYTVEWSTGAGPEAAQPIETSLNLETRRHLSTTL